MSDLPTYDPDWKRRWRRAKAIFDSLPEAAWEVRRTAAKGMQRAHDAQFRTVAEMGSSQRMSKNVR